MTILVHPTVKTDLVAALTEAGALNRTTLVESEEALNFSVWAEDAYAAVQDMATTPPQTYLTQPFQFPRYGDGLIANRVAEATQATDRPIRQHHSPLYFQGGNILIGDTFVLIGADYPAKTLRDHVEGRSKSIQVPPGRDAKQYIHELYAKTFGRQVLYVGIDEQRFPKGVPQKHVNLITVDGEAWEEIIFFGTGDKVQPIIHIDMFISLAGKGPNGKYRVLVGDPNMADKILDRPPLIQGMAPYFDNIASRLAADGFEVIRNPLPYTYVDYPEEKTRVWYFATANNCLVQIDAKAGNKVWLPSYGHDLWKELGLTDMANREIWQRLGFEVTMLYNFHPFAQNLGAVHCIKKYLDRQP